MDADSSKEEIKMLHRAIEKCGRDIVLSLSPGPALVEENEFYHENANLRKRLRQVPETRGKCGNSGTGARH